MAKGKYHSHVEPKLDLIESWRQKGESEENIADKLHVAYSTFRVYRDKYPALAAVLAVSREKLVAKIKKSLWKEAIGYEYEEKTEFIEGIMDKNGNFTGNKKIKRTITKKIARPQPNCIQFALCNLAPDEFQRLDKEAVKEIENKIDEKLEYNNDVFKALFEKLHFSNSENNKDDNKNE